MCTICDDVNSSSYTTNQNDIVLISGSLIKATPFRLVLREGGVCTDSVYLFFLFFL